MQTEGHSVFERILYERCSTTQTRENRNVYMTSFCSNNYGDINNKTVCLEPNATSSCVNGTKDFDRDFTGFGNTYDRNKFLANDSIFIHNCGTDSKLGKGNSKTCDSQSRFHDASMRTGHAKEKLTDSKLGISNNYKKGGDMDSTIVNGVTTRTRNESRMGDNCDGAHDENAESYRDKRVTYNGLDRDTSVTEVSNADAEMRRPVRPINRTKLSRKSRVGRRVSINEKANSTAKMDSSITKTYTKIYPLDEDFPKIGKNKLHTNESNEANGEDLIESSSDAIGDDASNMTESNRCNADLIKTDVEEGGELGPSESNDNDLNKTNVEKDENDLIESNDVTDSGQLTVASINALDDDIIEALEISETHGICVDKLQSVDEYKERFLLHVEKIEGGKNRKIKIEKAMIKAGQDDANRRQKLRSVMETMLSIIHKESPDVAGRRDSSEFVEDLLRMEGTSQDLANDCEAHIENMKNGECLVIVAGETSAGKSSILNLLFEDDILPVFNNSSTSTITTVRYNKRKHARIVYKDSHPDKVFDLDTAGIKLLQSVAFMRSASERENHNIQELQVFLPLPVLQSGLVLVDTPGIGENEFLETELINYISKHQIHGFMYIIKTDNAGGVQEDRLLNLLKIVIEQQKSSLAEQRLKFDPKSAIFIGNRIDLIKKEEVDKVKQNAIDKLSSCWPGLQPSQVVFFSTERAKRDVEADSDYINNNYKHFLTSLQELFMSALEKRIKVSYKWIEKVLKRIVHHLKSVVGRLDLTDKNLKIKSDSTREKLCKLRQKSDAVLSELRTSVDHQATDLTQFLKERLLSDSCRDTLIKQWKLGELPKVDAGLGDWPWIKVRIQDKFFDRLMDHIAIWERDEQKVESIEQEVSFQIKIELQILEDELNEIEREIQGDQSSDSSDGISQLAKSRRKSFGTLTPTRSRFLHTEPNLPLKLAGRLVKPFKAVFTPLKNKMRVSEYKANPVKVAEGCSKVMYSELITQPDHPDSQLMELANCLLDRPREFITAVERRMPDMILTNQLSLNLMEERLEREREHYAEYEEMMTMTESLRRSLMEYGEGYIFVNDFSRGELQIQQMHRESGDTVSVAFNVTDFLRGSSGDLTASRMRDIRGLWSVTYQGQLMRNGQENPVAIRVYLPSSGVSCTYKEVAKLRCLTCRGTGIAEFLGIHNADAATPAFVYHGSLRSVRKFMHSFCNKRDNVPEILMGTACGLEYLHNKGFVHMELTQDTITVDEVGCVQLTGACLPRESKLPVYRESIETGAFVYLSPETLRGEVYEATADIYSFGLLIIELTIPDMPVVFKDQRRMTLYDFTANLNPQTMLKLDKLLEVFTIKTRALIENCVEMDKDNRPLMSLVVEYTSFIKEETDALDVLPTRPTRLPVIKRQSHRLIESTYM